MNEIKISPNMLESASLLQLEGLFLGICLGDALSRTHGYKNPAYLLHGATGTWFLMMLQSAMAKNTDGLEEDISLRLQILHAPFFGAALRGRNPSLSQTLKRVASQYAKMRNLPTAAVVEVNGDLLPSMLAMSFFAPDDPEQRLHGLTQTIGATHHHPRVVSATALLVAAAQELSKEPLCPLDELLDRTLPFALSALKFLANRPLDVDAKGIALAQQALLHHVALGKGVSDPDDLGFPYGYDGRDSPEQLVVLALALSSLAQPSIEHLLQSLLEKGGASDVLAPLVAGIAGLRFGPDIFPKHWRECLLGQDLWHSHLSALKSGWFSATSLVESELKLSRLEDMLIKESGAIASRDNKEQLAFF